MYRLLVFFTLLLIIACNKSKPRIAVVEEQNLSQTQIDSILDEFNFVYDDLTFIDSTNQVMFPVTTQKQRGSKRLSSSGYDSWEYPRYWNILFYDHVTGETNLLTESKINIYNFFSNIIDSGPILQNSVLYEVSDQDYNRDKNIDYKDPTNLFISKIDGSELTRLSPKNENLEEYKIIPGSDKIIIKTLRDNNGDFDFDKEDEVIWYQIDLKNENILVEIVKPADRKMIEKLYFEQWLVKK